ncbi:12888_t:CDS:2, partial [Gigaspora margarita]
RLRHTELENNYIKEKGKKEENKIVPMEVSREKEKKATAEQMEIETNPISRKLTRITQGENKEEVLVNRRKHRLILESEDMYKAINIKINYSNTFLFWRDISGGKKVVNGFLKNTSKLNQKNTLYEKKITCSHNKKNESDEKLQIILQRLDKIEPKQKEGEETLREKEEGDVLKSKGDQEENKENREEARTKQLKRVTKGNNSKGKIKAKESLVESIKRDNGLEIRIACYNINGLKSNGLKLEALSD